MTEPHQIIVDPNQPNIVKGAVALIEQLVAAVGIGNTISILALALEQSLSSLLHMPTTQPEQNIDATNTILNRICEEVRSHEKCARMFNDTPTKEAVH